MKIEFADERIKEYSQGMGFHLKNEGKPIYVSSANGSELLNAKHWLDNEWVPTFKIVGEKPKKVADVKALAAEYPETFPHADVLTKAGIAYADVIQLDSDQLAGLKITGLGPKKLNEILAFSTEK
jgi:hypothetical protein